jgi:hypothetical protein
MTYDLDALTIYEKMVTERHLIWYRRQTNQQPPWTEDPILTNLKMTNMFRVLDPGSQFVFQLSDPDPIDTIARLVFYRITNLPSTWYAMRAVLGDFPIARDFRLRPEVILHTLNEHRAAGNRIFSGAYIIVPEPGTRNDKAEGAVRLTQRFIEEYAPAFLTATSQEKRFAVLRSTPGLGPFLSMQILTDWGYLQKRTPDLSFVIAGPGARRGAAILNPDIPAEQVIQEVYTEWAVDRLVRLGGKPLTPMDVQNTMCEWSKYHREIGTPRKKSVYRVAHPGAQPQPILPQWW